MREAAAVTIAVCSALNRVTSQDSKSKLIPARVQHQSLGAEGLGSRICGPAVLERAVYTVVLERAVYTAVLERAVYLRDRS